MPVGSSENVWHVRDTCKIKEQEVNFHNKGAELSGTAYLPTEGRKVPGIVVLHGASAPSRSSGLYAHLREGLPRIGIGVLVFDRRGTGKSSGSVRGVDYQTLADDAISGQYALGKLAPIDAKNVGFWGLSQGGWIAVLATSRSKFPAFAISVSAPLVSPERQMQFATSNLLRVRGYSQNDVNEMLRARKAWLGYLTRNITLAPVIKEMQRVERKPWFKLAFMPESRKIESSLGALKELYYDPMEALLSVRVPLLLIYGAEDPWIPVGESMKLLLEIEKKRRNISYTIIPDANHEMIFPRREAMSYDEKILNASRPEAPSYFMQMTMWLSNQVKKRSR